MLLTLLLSFSICQLGSCPGYDRGLVPNAGLHWGPNRGEAADWSARGNWCAWNLWLHWVLPGSSWLFSTFWNMRTGDFIQGGWRGDRSAQIAVLARDLSHITKLDGTHFYFWKFQISLALEQQDLWDVVTGKVEKPKEGAEEIKNCEKKDVNARLLLIVAIEQKRQCSLVNRKTSNEIWKRLLSLFEMSTESVLIKQKLFGSNTEEARTCYYSTSHSLRYLQHN